MKNHFAQQQHFCGALSETAFFFKIENALKFKNFDTFLEASQILKKDYCFTRVPNFNYSRDSRD